MKSKVLIVDDEQDIRELIRFYINKEGYEVIEAKDGEEALEIFESEYIDLCIIDVMMPKMDGLGFSVGVDDYVVKPFDPNELMARVKAVMRRYDINASNIIMLKDVELDGEKYEIRYKDETIHLPLKQFELLFELAKHPNQIFSREQLIEKIWGMDYDGFDRTVDVHIKRIRENIGHLPGFSVVTVRGLGYKVEVE